MSDFLGGGGRDATVQSVSGGDPTVDVIVIGGGVNGTGVARDCALRGLKVALFEKNDLGFGASGNSSGMIHGGPRYLTKNPQVTYSSCLDSGHIQRIAPHMLFRVPFLLPVLEGGLRGAAELATYDGFFEVYDRYQSLKRGKTHLRFTGDEVGQLEPSLIPVSGGVSFDEWGIDGVRLCVASLTDAVERGARAYVHSTVTGVERTNSGLSVTYQEQDDRTVRRLTARVVVNATGAWAPLTARLSSLSDKVVRLRPGKGIHVYLDRRLSNFAIVTQAKDGRQVFLLPWQNMSVLGTTDDDFYGDLDDVVATTSEVRYLREAISRVVPAVSQARAIGTWGGVRPTLYEWGKDEDSLSRDHRIEDHERHGMPGFYSMLGGKLASYRLFAEEMTDAIASRLRVRATCQTHLLPLPGGDEVVGREEAQALAEAFGLDEVATRRLCARHGTGARRLLLEGTKEKTALHVVCPCEPVTEAEIRHVVRREWARSVEDVSRRTRLGLGSCAGMRCAAACGRIVAEERQLSPEEGLKSAAEFLRAGLRRRLPAMGPEQARQEALLAAHAYAQAGISAQNASPLASFAVPRKEDPSS